MQEQNVHTNKCLTYILLALVVWIIFYLSLILKYSIAELPFYFSVLFVVNLILFYLLIKNNKKIAEIFKTQFQSLTKVENSELQDEQESEIEEKKVDKELNKNLLKGITKRTTKKALSEKLLSNLIKEQEAEIGIYYTYVKKTKSFQVSATYAYLAENDPPEFKPGEGINGQVVKNKKAMRIDNVEETHLKVVSGLGKGKPLHLFIYPIILNNTVIGLIEMGSFHKFSKNLEEELTIFFETNSDKFLNIEDK